MEQGLLSQLDRIETALTTLTTSITTYNPSVSAAQDLFEADTHFTRGIDRLIRHQQNHARLLRLRSTAERLDGRIKDSVGRLAGVRRELIEAPWTESVQSLSLNKAGGEEADNDEEGGGASKAGRQDGARKVSMGELLSYAQKIAKTSLPPNYRQEFEVPVRPIAAPDPEAGDEEPADTQVTEPPSTNGLTTTNGTNALADTSTKIEAEGEGKLEGDQENLDTKEDRGAAYTTLSPQSKSWLDELKNLPFVPWPNEDLIKNGALGSLQKAVERGEDPWIGREVPSSTTLVGETEGKINGLGDVDMGEQEPGIGQAARAVRPSAPVVPAAAAPALFGMYDPDEEDE